MFVQRRPYVRATLRLGAGGWNGDVQMVTLDGASLIFNGVGPFLLLRATRTDEASGGTRGCQVVSYFQVRSIAAVLLERLRRISSLDRMRLRLQPLRS